MRAAGIVSFRFWPVVLAALLALSAARAQGADTLERIRGEGVLRIGYGDTPPFSFRDESGRVTGYSIELCERVAEDIRRQLGLERIGIVYVPRTDMNRIPLLNEGRYDLECEASTNSEERRRSVAFALAHFFTETRFVSLARHDLRRVADLKGRSMAVALGTVTIGQIGRLNRERRLELSLVRAETVNGAFDLLARGEVSAFAMDDILLRFMVARTGNAALYRLSEESLTPALPYGFMMRLDDTAFHAAVNAALARIYGGAEMDALYDRWFRGPVPGLGVRLGVPQSPELAAHFAAFRGK